MRIKLLFPGKESRTREYFNVAVLLGLVLLLGTALRLYDLGTESYWVDEMFTIIESQQSIHQILTSGRLDQPPAYYLPFHLWTNFFGLAESATRLFSALTGIGSIVLIYLIGRNLFGQSIGILSAFLMTISEYQIYYSQQTRYYSFFEFTTLLSFLFFILALGSKKRIHFVLYGVASALMVYSHTYGVFILAAQNLCFALQVKKYRDLAVAWFVCQTLIVLAFSPYFLTLIFGGGGLSESVYSNSTSTPPPLLLDPLRSVYRFIMPARRDRSWEIIFVNYAAAGAIFITGVGINVFRQGVKGFVRSVKELTLNSGETPDFTGKILLLVCWLLIPILLPFILSWVIAPMYLDRYVIGASPALYLFLALILFGARKVMPLIFSIMALLIVVVPGLVYYYETDVNEQWGEVAAYLMENSEPGMMVVFAPNEGAAIEQKTFNWYYRGSLQGCGLSIEVVESSLISSELKQCVAGRQRFWVVIRGTPEIIHRFQSFFLGPSQTDVHMIKDQAFQGIYLYLFEVRRW